MTSEKAESKTSRTGKYTRNTEHRILMSSIKKGFKHTEVTKEKLRKVNLGKRYSPETNNKKSLPGKLNGMYGKKRPDLAERNRNIHLNGSRNPSWLGGISFLPYGYEFNKSLKLNIKTRDNFRCKRCGFDGNAIRLSKEKNQVLTVHHIDYNKQNNKTNNLITLCNKCNSEVNKDREYWKIYFSLMLNGK
jgi:hypothetical protein